MTQAESTVARAAAEAARETAGLLLDIDAVRFAPDEPFVLTSGRKSPVYVDCRRIISFPRARRRLLELAEAVLVPANFSCIAGAETAGIPFAAMLAERLELPMVYVRKAPKDFGRKQRIEGAFAQGDEALLVEDMMTDGGSKLDFVRALREAGLPCARLFVFFRYGVFPEGEARLRAEGLELDSLACWEDVLEVARERAALDDNALEAVRAFLQSPDTWTP